MSDSRINVDKSCAEWSNDALNEVIFSHKVVFNSSIFLDSFRKDGWTPFINLHRQEMASGYMPQEAYRGSSPCYPGLEFRYFDQLVSWCQLCLLFFGMVDPNRHQPRKWGVWSESCREGVYPHGGSRISCPSSFACKGFSFPLGIAVVPGSSTRNQIV